MSQITDLTGTKWLLNSELYYDLDGIQDNMLTMFYAYDATAWYKDSRNVFEIGPTGINAGYLNFTSNNENFVGLVSADYTPLKGGNFVEVYRSDPEDGWSNQSYRTIEITGGTDATNADLIAWLQSNATQIIEPTGNPYLTFSSPGSFTLVTDKTWDGTLEYSTDTQNWDEWNGDEISAQSDGTKYNLYLRGTGNTIISDGNAWSIDSSNYISCEGNIENLLDYQTVALGNHPVMGEYCFAGLFNLWEWLISVPELPATTLSLECYNSMCVGCSLTTLPELPATTLAPGCYESMFSGTNIKLSETQTGNYTKPYRIPASGTGIDAAGALTYMFTDTGGTFTGTPTINTTYYLWSEEPEPEPQEDTKISIGTQPLVSASVGNAEMKAIWVGNVKVWEKTAPTTYDITVTVTNGTSAGDTTIQENGTATVTITASSGYNLPSSITVSGATYAYDSTTGVITLSAPTGAVSISVVCESGIGTLEETDWATIKQVSDAGTASQYWNIGDSKTITLNGTIGTLTVNNLQLKAYILGFDHNIAVESGGSYSHSITFGFALDANNVNVALCDSHYVSTSTDGSKWFNMNHSANTNSGGWKGCDMRYDILGSVEVKNQQDATSAATSSPVENTLMAALPSALRAVMKPITKYTDNVGGRGDTAANVTTTVDYLPLLAEYEIFGSRSFANSTEQSHQAQYAFYANGNSKVKYNHSSTSSAVHWWERSALYSSSKRFCSVYYLGSATTYSAQSSLGVAPIFAV